jgi:hypothetical protein
VAELLEFAQLAQANGVPEVNVGCGGIEALLDAQWPALALAELEALEQRPLGEDLLRPP